MFNFHSFKRSKNLVLSENREAELRRQLTKQSRIGQNNQERNVARSTRGYAGFGIEAPKELLEAIYSGKPFTVPVVPKFKTDVPLEVGVLGKTKGSLGNNDLILKTLKNIETKFKQPTVVNVSNDNQFICQNNLFYINYFDSQLT